MKHGDLIHADVPLAVVFAECGKCSKCRQPIGQVLLRSYPGNVWFKAVQTPEGYRIHDCHAQEAA